MNFYSVINKDTETLIWDLVEFENGNIAGYNYFIEQIFLYHSLENFILCEKNETDEIIKEGVNDEIEDDEEENIIDE